MGNVQVHQDNSIRRRGKRESETMGQQCSSLNGVVKNTARKKTNLEVALDKIVAHGADPNDLPKARTEPLWDRIETTYDLTLAELSALKNYVCPGVARGVLRGVHDEAVYKISDKRVRCSFIISRVEGNMSMPADLMLDSGAEGELKLPGRKVIQLGLQTLGSPVRTKGSSNSQGFIWNFYPQVMVSATILREDENGATKEEVVQAPMTVRADKEDYDAALEMHTEKESESKLFRTPPPESPPWLASTSAGDTTHITSGIIHLSPVRHRPQDRPNEQATLGIAGLAKLNMHINAKEQQLEIEEEEFMED